MFLSVGRRYGWTVITLLLLVGCGTVPGDQGANENTRSTTVTPDSELIPESGQSPFSEELIETAASYQELRHINGQFSGGGWVEEVDAWNGRKHQLMQTIAQELQSATFSETEIIQLVGEPDQRLSAEDPLFDTLISTSQSQTGSPTQLLIYYWRGTHDFLYMHSQNKQITAVDWWYAGE